MKSVKVISYVLWVMGVLLLSTPTMAQQQEWQSTSAMQQVVGSTYSPNVQQVGATSVPMMATTTESYSPSSAPGIRKAKKEETQDDRTPGEASSGSSQSPIGDAVLPLLLMACAYLAFRVARRRREALTR